jgi:asparagine synthase (glutamine-hydrolysing)
MTGFILEIPFHKTITDLSGAFIKKPRMRHHFSNDAVEFIAWGDPIIPENFNDNFYKDQGVSFIVNNVCGHYYYLWINKIGGKVNIGNSLFSILPIYYYQLRDKIILSENALDIGEYTGNQLISRRFNLETILFNYPLFNHSIIEGVKLLPSNSYISITDNEFKIEKHTHIETYFTHTPKPWRKAVNEIRDLFLESALKYLPEKPYITSLTGGFDGRTLVSAGLFHKREFSCYAFGESSSMDSVIAAELAKIAEIQFLNIALDDDYAKSQSLGCGLEFIQNASGTATFARAHYLHAIKQLAGKTEYIITGNFGSEIFRAAHNPGVVFAPNLYHLFNASSPEKAFPVIENSTEFASLNKAAYKKEWRHLKEDFLMLPCFHPDYKMLTQNQKFYVFVFEEVFRKYFGAEMVNQFRYLSNRTPFLDLNFIKAIFNTELAGIHSGFFEHNPLKRYKGQVLYAHIIQKAFPQFGRMMTDKGYRPDDLISFSGKLNIIRGYMRKIIQKNKAGSDPYGVGRAWACNREFFNKVPVDPALFNLMANRSNEVLYKLLSLSYLKVRLENKMHE